MNATRALFPFPISAFSFQLSAFPHKLSAFCFLLFLCSPLLAADATAPAVSSPVVSGPLVSGPVVSSPVVSGQVVSGQVVSSPVVSSPVVSSPVVSGHPADSQLPTPNSQLPTPNPQPSTLNPQLSGGFITMDTMDDKHKLALGDQLTFRIVEDQEDPNEKMEPKPMMVGDRGEVEVPYIGPFPAVGKTCKQLAREIKTQLEKKYYYQATVLISLQLRSKTTGKVYVLGEVRLTGPVDMPGDEALTVGKAILRAGGFTTYSDKRHVKVTRKNETTGAKSQTFVLNVADILEKGKADMDVPLETGDVIYVPSRLINF